MDLRLDIERRKRFAGKDRDYKREGGRSPGGSRGPSRERSSEKSGKHHKKSKYVPLSSELQWLPFLESITSEFHLLRFTPALCFVLTGRLKRSVIALHPPPPPRPLLPPTLHLSEVKTTWERGWSTRRRATVTPVFLHGTTAGPQTEVLGSMRATTRREAEAVDL